MIRAAGSFSRIGIAPEARRSKRGVRHVTWLTIFKILIYFTFFRTMLAWQKLPQRVQLTGSRVERPVTAAN